MRLSTLDHDRGAAELTYVYPVVSRRAGGVSVGINLNPNDACNWRCIYCQVPGLVFGRAPEIDLGQLESELEGFLARVVEGDFLERHVPEDARRLHDVAFSGNGEPTSSPQLGEALEVLARVRRRFGLEELETVLITNGSLVHKPDVAAALDRLATLRGEVWFKLDRVTDAGQAAVNGARAGAARSLENLRLSARRCRTWIQTCFFALDDEPPPENELHAYLTELERVVAEGVPVEGVLLYGLARPSHQPESPRLSALAEDAMGAYAERIRATGLACRLSV